MSRENHVSLGFAPKVSWQSCSIVIAFYSISKGSSGGSEEFWRNEVFAFKTLFTPLTLLSNE